MRDAVVLGVLLFVTLVGCGSFRSVPADQADVIVGERIRATFSERTVVLRRPYFDGAFVTGLDARGMAQTIDAHGALSVDRAGELLRARLPPAAANSK